MLTFLIIAEAKALVLLALVVILTDALLRQEHQIGSMKEKLDSYCAAKDDNGNSGDCNA